MRQTGRSNGSGSAKPEGDVQRHDTQGMQAVRRNTLGVTRSQRDRPRRRGGHGFTLTDEIESEATFELYEGGEHRWRLRHRNGNILAGDGQGYATRSGVWNGIESTKHNAPNAGVDEVEEY